MKYLILIIILLSTIANAKIRDPPMGDFIWRIPGTGSDMPREVMRIKTDGTVQVNGKTIGDDVEIYNALERFYKGYSCKCPEEKK